MNCPMPYSDIFHIFPMCTMCYHNLKDTNTIIGAVIVKK